MSEPSLSCALFERGEEVRGLIGGGFGIFVVTPLFFSSVSGITVPPFLSFFFFFFLHPIYYFKGAENVTFQMSRLTTHAAKLQ